MSTPAQPQFFITRGPYGFDYQIRFGFWDAERNVLTAAEPITMKVYGPRDDRNPEAMISLIDSIGQAEPALQSLMDELWRIGIRPKDIGTAGHLAATQQHLADFRAIVAKQLEVTLA